MTAPWPSRRRRRSTPDRAPRADAIRRAGDEIFAVSLYINGLHRKTREKAGRKHAKSKAKAGEKREQNAAGNGRIRFRRAGGRRKRRRGIGAAPARFSMPAGDGANGAAEGRNRDRWRQIFAVFLYINGLHRKTRGKAGRKRAEGRAKAGEKQEQKRRRKLVKSPEFPLRGNDEARNDGRAGDPSSPRSSRSGRGPDRRSLRQLRMELPVVSFDLGGM